MAEPRSIPVALNIVALLFLLEGIGAVVDVVVEFSRGITSLNALVLGIPIFFGLRRFASGWRTTALVFVWLCLIGTPAAIIYTLLSGEPAPIYFLGGYTAVLPIWPQLLIGLAGFCLSLWQYRVLTRPSIRNLFYSNPLVTTAPNQALERTISVD
jgi:hypothetical protein